MTAKQTVWEAKQLWLQRLMASAHTPAQKVWAWGVFDRMFGDKVTAYPETEALAEATHLNDSKFSEHRKALFESGALTGERKRFKGRWENYTYTLNLNWDGQVNRTPSGGMADTNHTPSGGTDQTPTGGTDHTPSGGTNTSIQTINSNTSTDNGAVAPVVREDTTSPSKSQKTTEVLVPPTSSNNPDGAVGVVRSTDRHTPSGGAVDRRHLAATFGETREQTAARLARQEAAARIGGDW